MSVAVDIKPLPSHVHATLSGEFTVDGVKTALTQMVRAGHGHPNQKLLIDCLGLRGDPSLRERFELVSHAFQLRINAVMEGKRPVLQTAIVAVPPLAHPNRYAVRLLVERSIRDTLCERTDEALAWLGVPGGQEGAATSGPAG